MFQPHPNTDFEDVHHDSLTTIRVAGVPEHFNLPWLMAIQNGTFERLGIRLEFVEVPGGTGAMMQMLESGEADIAVALTEGIIAHIIKTPSTDIRLIGTYVESPLIWGISVGSSISSVEDLKGKTFGISREGSGSQLMAYVLSEKQNWPQSEVHFATKHNFKGLRDSIVDDSSQAFLWEAFMTKPFYDSGVLKKVGEVEAPWPAFMVCARQSWLTSLEAQGKHVAVQKMFEGLEESCTQFKANQQESIKMITQKFGIKEEDATAWLSHVQYSTDNSLSSDILQSTMSTLNRVGVIPCSVEPASLCAPHCSQLKA